MIDLVRYLRSLDGRDVAVHLPARFRQEVVDACRAAGKRLAELHEHPAIVVTADADVEGGVVHPLKDEVDAIAPDATRVIVFRLAGDAALAPTLDAYLDVVMVPGRDVWADHIGASE